MGRGLHSPICVVVNRGVAFAEQVRLGGKAGDSEVEPLQTDRCLYATWSCLE